MIVGDTDTVILIVMTVDYCSCILLNVLCSLMSHVVSRFILLCCHVMLFLDRFTKKIVA
jgi:hypothetical protein